MMQFESNMMQQIDDMIKWTGLLDKELMGSKHLPGGLDDVGG